MGAEFVRLEVAAGVGTIRLDRPKAMNAIRLFPSGITSWGARMMVGADDTGNVDDKYVNVRRMMLFIENSLYRGLRFAVFKNNAEPLWASIRLAAGSFMNGLMLQGAFASNTKRDAYYVLCDSSTTTANDINLGIVNVVGSTIAREADGGIYLHAGPEVAVEAGRVGERSVRARGATGRRRPPPARRGSARPVSHEPQRSLCRHQRAVVDQSPRRFPVRVPDDLCDRQRADRGRREDRHRRRPSRRPVGSAHRGGDIDVEPAQPALPALHADAVVGHQLPLAQLGTRRA